MPISNTESLILLIRSLSKSEKRSFKLYARRNQDGKDVLFVKLFEELDKKENTDEKAIRKKLGNLSATSYSNLKKHLFEQMMISLRLLQKEKKQNFKIREYIDFAYVLYGKGLHMQALDVLRKAKALSKKYYNDFSLLTIIELEKLIQSRHITRSKSEPIAELIDESYILSERVSQRIALSNIRIWLHKLYIQQGHLESLEKETDLTIKFEEAISKIQEADLEGIELIYYYQSYVWFHYILDQFDQCKKWAHKWVTAFKSSDELKKRDVDLFMRGYHYVLTSCFNIKDTKDYEATLIELEKFRYDNYKKLNHNSQIVSFQYVHNGRMNLHFLKGTFKEGLKKIPSTLNRINRYADKLDYHKIMVIYYKVAWMYIGAGLPQKSIKYLDYIIDLTDKSLREDIQCYARIMQIMAYYDLEKYNTIIEKTPHFLKFHQQMKHSNQVQLITLETIKELSEAPIFDRKEILSRRIHLLEKEREKRFERKALIYLDLLTWLKSKLRKTSVAEVIQSSLS